MTIVLPAADQFPIFDALSTFSYPYTKQAEYNNDYK